MPDNSYKQYLGTANGFSSILASLFMGRFDFKKEKQ